MGLDSERSGFWNPVFDNNNSDLSSPNRSCMSSALQKFKVLCQYPLFFFFIIVETKGNTELRGP